MSSSVLYLYDKDFEIREWNSKNIFALARPSGLVLVYFFTPTCDFCRTFSPFFQGLPARLKGGIQIGIVNASQREMLTKLKQSHNTTTPITEVPYVLLYNNGWPVERYTGPPDLESVKSFLETIIRERLSNQSPEANSQKTPVTPPEPQNPKNPNTVCYLTYGEAYKG